MVFTDGGHFTKVNSNSYDRAFLNNELNYFLFKILNTVRVCLL
jgi:hypothetical protein